MAADIWHFSRPMLAGSVLGMFDTGLSSALVFFAPRRMGKTEFLLKDMLPLAMKKNWQAFYFSFLDSGANAEEVFTQTLIEFSQSQGGTMWGAFRDQVKKVEAGIGGLQAGIEFRDAQQLQSTLKEVLAELATSGKKILLLLDEVQALAANEKNKDFIAALRTALDIHKDTLKVIFTGSSREGLRRMFSKSDAPFFHFGQNLPFPELERDFVEHLVAVCKRATGRELNVEQLWAVFLKIDRVPQLFRSLVERMVLHPDLSVVQAHQQLMQDLIEDREYPVLWEQCSVMERLLIKAIVLGKNELFGQEMRDEFAKQIGVNELSISTLQSAIRSLMRKNIIGNLPGRGKYFIDDPNLKTWIEQVTLSGTGSLK